ncbi:RING zinc finger transcription negative regulator protein [Naegleria gruberi]|uniref:RING zinc finger transcription negative regulator protein n=1 Tax=Naegleria gruberi TaxID=5762 RepID=D2V231_NAEGR|nr:RING zinc finger transcription negative regulator protein [Naegleria gruberi]EFC48982.1 RING zinc finger transcription negative regulator protein [Naegleria gruberi]|eukprot:XP_002681726.1 RING zinc finger transcription negative regulator protein [Naegleria gruberi strain NEG-M]
MSDYSSDEDTTCPICCEDLDITDKHFQPCPCGFKICSWCWNKIDNTSKRCPNCRREYEKSNIEFTPPDPELIQQEKKQKEKKKKPHINRKQLANVRVIQRNLVYVVGLTLVVAKHDWLKHQDNFGKYGKIKKVVINKSNLHNSTHIASNRTPTVSAYITYVRKEDAYKAIRAVDKTYLDAKQLRASFGTTKYCAYFLKGIPCTNPDCMYLHEYGNDEDTFNKDEIVLRNGLPVPHNLEKMSQFYPPDDDSQPIDKHFWKYQNSNKEPEGDESNEDDDLSAGGANSRSNPLRHYDIMDDDDDNLLEEDLQDDDYADDSIGNTRPRTSSSSRSRHEYDHHSIDDYYYGGDDDGEEEEEDDEVQTEYADLTTKVLDNSKESILPKTARWGQPTTPIVTPAVTSPIIPVNLPTNITKSKKKNKIKNKNKNKNKNKKSKQKETEATEASTETTEASTTTITTNDTNNTEANSCSSGRSSTDPSGEDLISENQEKVAISVIDNININEESTLDQVESQILETHPTLEMLGLESGQQPISSDRSALLALVDSKPTTNGFNGFGMDQTQQGTQNSFTAPQNYQQVQNQYYGYPQQVQQLFATFQYDPYYQYYGDAWSNGNQNVDTKRTSSRFFGGNPSSDAPPQQQQQPSQQSQPQQMPHHYPYGGHGMDWNMQSVPYLSGSGSGQQTSRFFGGSSNGQGNEQMFNNADLQNSFRALLPNVNITFAKNEGQQNNVDWGMNATETEPNHQQKQVDPYGVNQQQQQAYSGFFTQQNRYPQQTQNSWSWK